MEKYAAQCSDKAPPSVIKTLVKSKPQMNQAFKNPTETRVGINSAAADFLEVLAPTSSPITGQNTFANGTLLFGGEKDFKIMIFSFFCYFL